MKSFEPQINRDETQIRRAAVSFIRVNPSGSCRICGRFSEVLSGQVLAIGGRENAEKAKGKRDRACRHILLSYFDSMTLKVLIHSAEEGGFWAEVPALPGCVSQGETMDELRSNVREAIEGWLMAEDDGAKSKSADEVIEVAV
jgi:predicted RNase H-like HicB family nuclease